jgi:hypothetical protein
MKNPELLNAIMNAGARLDYDLITQFLSESIEANKAHFDLIKGTLTEHEEIRRLRLICQGSILLSLITSTKL